MSHQPDLVPELAVCDLDASLGFWCGLIGFSVRYARPQERFACISLGRSHVMLDQIGVGRTWRTAELEPPLGRGVNIEIRVPDLDAISRRLEGADWPYFVEPEERWYAAGDVLAGVRQFVVMDPDGYLLRPQVEIGRRPIDQPS